MSDGVILVADDDENDVLLFKRTLRALKISNPVRVVVNGEDAIRYLNGDGEYSDRSNNPLPILLVLNLQMPRRNGMEVLAWIQLQKDLPPMKVLILSGFPESRQAMQARHFGAVSFLRKPPDPQTLLNELKTMESLNITSIDGFVRLSLRD